MGTLGKIRNRSGLLLAVIGIAMLHKPNWNNSQTFKIELNGKRFDVKVCDLPFI